jgi:hypothetical protein
MKAYELLVPFAILFLFTTSSHAESIKNPILDTFKTTGFQADDPTELTENLLVIFAMIQNGSMTASNYSTFSPQASPVTNLLNVFTLAESANNMKFEKYDGSFPEDEGYQSLNHITEMYSNINPEIKSRMMDSPAG